MKVHLLFALALALLGLMGTAGAQGDAGDMYVEETRVNTIENLFTYENTPDAEDKLAGAAGDAVPTEHPMNAAYRAELGGYIRAEQFEAVSGGLRFRALRSLAVNSLCVLEWSIENVSDEPLRLEAGCMEVSGGCGDIRRAVSSGRVLQPGERVLCVAADSRFDRQGEELDVRVKYDVYRAAGEQSAAVFDMSVRRDRADAMSALTGGEVVEREWRGSTLRVTEAWQSLAGGSYTVLRIFDTEEQARANSPFSESWWDVRPYCTPDEDGRHWIAIGGGEGDDEPFRLEDGRWAYSITHTASMLNWLPKGSVYLVPMTEEGGDWQSAIELELKYALPQPLSTERPEI